jgi:hypothetical protein
VSGQGLEFSTGIKMSNLNGYGGARPGAGRKPKALRYAHEVAAAERTIIAAIPEMLAIIFKAARTGDVSAARYIMDRGLGRVQTQAKPIAEDYTLPFDDPAAEEVATLRRRRELAREVARPAANRSESVHAELDLLKAEMGEELRAQFEAAKVPVTTAQGAAAKTSPAVVDGQSAPHQTPATAAGRRAA